MEKIRAAIIAHLSLLNREELMIIYQLIRMLAKK